MTSSQKSHLLPILFKHVPAYQPLTDTNVPMFSRSSTHLATSLLLLAHAYERAVRLEDNVAGGAQRDSLAVHREAVGAHTGHVHQRAVTEAGRAVVHCVRGGGVELAAGGWVAVVHEEQSLEELIYLGVIRAGLALRWRWNSMETEDSSKFSQVCMEDI